MDLIRFKNVKKTYKSGTTAIYDLDLTIEKGEFVFIMGSTGCGKSTLIKMLYLPVNRNPRWEAVNGEAYKGGNLP